MLERKISFVLWQTLKYEYNQKINEENINYVSFWKIYQIFKNEEVHLKEIYLHNIISKWIDNQKFINEEEKIASIKKLIRKTRIKLNQEEKEQMLLLEERAFAIERNIKRIDVNLKIRKKEQVGAKYVNADLFLFLKNGKFKLIKNACELLISNRRFIFDQNKHFNFNQIEWFEFNKVGFVFKYFDKKVYVFRLYDNQALNNTILNIFKRQRKILTKEKTSLYL